MRYILACMLVLALGTLSNPAHAAADVLTGAWSGGGTVKLTEGGVEKVRCRIRYSKSTGETYVLDATCSHSNGTISQTGRVARVSGSRFTGRLYSDQYDVSGKISVSVNGNKQTLSLSSAKGSGSITLSKR